MTKGDCDNCEKLVAKDIALLNKLHVYHKIMTKQEDEIKELRYQVLEFENKWEEARLKVEALEE